MTVAPAETKEEPGLGISLLPIVGLIALLAFNVYLFGDNALSGPHQIALLSAAAVTVGLSLTRGGTWLDMQRHIVHGISIAIPAVLILLMVGALSGTWLISGIVPAMIYYGLHVLSPVIFLFAACFISAIVALATGSSWTTSATVGIALMGIGATLGIHEGMVAGAVLSGAYFGDKMSPLSDTTNLAAGVAGVDLFTHIRYMMLTTWPSISIALLLYLGIGFFGVATDREIASSEIYDALQSRFDINPLLMVVPVAVVVMIIRRMPALPAIFIGALLGGVFALVFQPDVVVAVADDGASEYAHYVGLVKSMTMETTIKTGDATIDELLSSGGMAGMLPTIWLILSAMVFGSTMEHAGFLARITRALLSVSRHEGSLFATAAGTCLVTNVTASDQYLAIAIPGRMYAHAFHEHGLAPQNLSRTLEDSGTVTSVLVPWNTCGAYNAGVLGVATLTYAPFAFFCMLSPLMTVLYGALKFRLTRLEPTAAGAATPAPG